MNNKEVKINVGDKVFILEINNKHYLQVFKRLNGSNPIGQQDFPTGIQNNINSFAIFIDAISQVEISLNITDDDGIYDNFGNIYGVISDFQ